MSELDAIATALAARVAPATAGTLLTFRVDDVWMTMTGRLSPHLELSMRAPELAGLSLWIQLGAPTLLGDNAAGDDRWQVRSNDRARSARLLAEAPWQAAAQVREGLPLLPRLVCNLVYYLTYFLVHPDAAGTSPTPRYVLEVADGVATIERRTNEINDALAVGAALRLLQLVTFTGRQQRAAADAARRAPPRLRGPYR